MAKEFPPFPFVQPVDPNIGRRVDAYFVLRSLLGKGGMGAAYLAEHEARANVKCVVKLVLADFAQHPLAITRYRMETEAVSLLKHDNIVKLHNFGVLEDGQLFMRFEYIEGKSLYRHISERGGRLSIREAAYLTFQLCDAFDHAHSCGVVHRDVKPDNVMVELDPPGSHLTQRVKLLDFGIAKVATTTMEHTASGTMMGTARFAAPEQMTNAASATGKADVFSLATIFYFAVTGNLPWGTPESDVAIYHKQRTEAPIEPPEPVMPREVRRVVFRALSIQPEDRPTMREFAILLAAAIRAEGRLPSGAEILRDVKRSWSSLSPPHIPTLPRPVTDPENAGPPELPIEPPAAASEPSSGGSPLDPAPASELSPSAEGPHPSASDLTITARGRPRAIAASLASADHATFNSPPAAARTPAGTSECLPALPMNTATAPPSPRPATPTTPIIAALPGLVAASPQRHLATPIIAALPTGLTSQRYVAQESPVDVREASITVASEIEMATGTPGPQPYAHAALPLVVVSNTQLSGLSADASAPPPPFARQAESPPFVVLPPGAQGKPSAMRSHSRKLALLSVATIIAAAVVVRLVSHANTSGSERASTSSASLGTTTAGADASDAAPPAFLPAAPTAATVDPGQPVASPAVPPAASHQPPPSAVAADVAPHPQPTDVGVHSRPAHGQTSSSSRAVVETSPPHGEVSTESPRAARSTEPQKENAQKNAQTPPLTFRAGAKKTGKLTILVTPWALAWLDGKPLDQTPVVLEDAPVGRHRLHLENKIVKREETLTVTINPDQPTTIQRTW